MLRAMVARCRSRMVVLRGIVHLGLSACVTMGLAQLTSVEAVMEDVPAHRPVVSGYGLGGGSTRALVAFKLMLDEVVHGVGVHGTHWPLLPPDVVKPHRTGFGGAPETLVLR